jgi:hypothetical protein
MTPKDIATERLISALKAEISGIEQSDDYAPGKKRKILDQAKKRFNSVAKKWKIDEEYDLE